MGEPAQQVDVIVSTSLSEIWVIGTDGCSAGRPPIHITLLQPYHKKAMANGALKAMSLTVHFYQTTLRARSPMGVSTIRMRRIVGRAWAHGNLE